VDEDQVLARLDVVVELPEILVLRGYPGQAAFPRAEHRRDGDDHEIDVVGNIRAERLEVHQQSGADQSRDGAKGGADEPVAQDIQRLQIVAGVDMFLLQPGFVLGDDVQEEIPQSRSVQVVGYAVRALERGREIVEAIHTPSVSTLALSRALAAGETLTN